MLLELTEATSSPHAFPKISYVFAFWYDSSISVLPLPPCFAVLQAMALLRTKHCSMLNMTHFWLLHRKTLPEQSEIT